MIKIFRLSFSALKTVERTFISICARKITNDYFLRGKNTNNQEQIWFAGGATRDTANDAIWRFTPKDNKMSRMGRMLQPRYRVSLLFSSRQLDRNAAGRGRHQLMVDGGNHPGKLTPLLEVLA